MADLLAAVASAHDSSSSAQLTGKDENGAVIGLSSEQLAGAKESAISWAAAHGLLVGWRDPASKTPSSAVFTHIPFCLFPVQVRCTFVLWRNEYAVLMASFADCACGSKQLPQAQFEHGVALSPVYGRLVDRVSRDIEWLHSTVST